MINGSTESVTFSAFQKIPFMFENVRIIRSKRLQGNETIAIPMTAYYFLFPYIYMHVYVYIHIYTF